MSTIINALLPVFVTLLIGYFAAWHHDIEGKSVEVLNKMVISYTLPLGLFAGVLAAPRELLAANLPLGAILLVGMLIPFVATLLVARRLAGRSLAESTLQAMAVSLPAIPFVGLPVLSTLFGPPSATITVAIGSIVTILVIVPLSITLLNVAAHQSAAVAVAKANAPTTSMSGSRLILSSLEQPMVWAPLLGVLLVILGVKFPASLIRSMELLGSTTSGISLFASGVILRAYRPSFSPAIAVSIVGRLVIVPGLVLLALPPLGIPARLLGDAVVSMGLPCAVMLVILSVRYRIAERESASVLLYSYVVSALTLAVVIMFGA